jgi:hypothetical protein
MTTCCPKKGVKEEIGQECGVNWPSEGGKSAFACVNVSDVIADGAGIIPFKFHYLHPHVEHSGVGVSPFVYLHNPVVHLL